MGEIPKSSQEQSDYDRVDSIWTGGFEESRRMTAKNGYIVFGTDIGVRRQRQEDRLVVNTEKDSFAVIDGMGGMGYGDVAAQALAEQLQQGFIEETKIRDVQVSASRTMAQRGVGRGGACYLAVQIVGRELVIHQAGDVRLVAADALGRPYFETEDQGYGTSVANAVTGTGPGTTKMYKKVIRGGTRLYLASDGLWGNVSTEETLKATASDRSDVAIKKLADMAKKQMGEYEGTPDNITILIYDVLLKRQS